MSDQSNHSVSISVDMKKYRIRIHKSTLHLLGDPSFIQLLINPELEIVAIKSANSPTPSAHKVSKDVLLSDNSIEIYSRYFVLKLKEVSPELNPGHTYRMSGEIISSENMAVFSLGTLSIV